MLELKIVDESRAVHYLVLAQGRRTGEIAHEDFNGLCALRLDDGDYAIRRDRRAADLARGRRGLLRAVWSRLQPAQSYTLLQGDKVLAEIHNHASLLRSAPITLQLPGDAASWSVPPPRGVAQQLRVCRGDVDVGQLRIPGLLLRERILLPPLELPRPVAVTLAWAAHQCWGNDPYRGNA